MYPSLGELDDLCFGSFHKLNFYFPAVYLNSPLSLRRTLLVPALSVLYGVLSIVKKGRSQCYVSVIPKYPSLIVSVKRKSTTYTSRILPLFCGRATRISKKYLSFYQSHIQPGIKTNGVQNCILLLKNPRPFNPVVINLGSALAPSVKFTSVSFSGTLTMFRYCCQPLNTMQPT